MVTNLAELLAQILWSLSSLPHVMHVVLSRHDIHHKSICQTFVEVIFNVSYAPRVLLVTKIDAQEFVLEFHFSNLIDFWNWRLALFLLLFLTHI